MTRPKKFSPFGNDLFGDQIIPQENSVLKQKFLFSPFSVLNSREGAWQERKAAWLSLGIEGEVGRGGNLMKHNTEHYDPDFYKKKNAGVHRGGAEDFNHDEWAAKNNISEDEIKKWMSASPGKVSRHNVIEQLAGMKTGWTSGTSIFDPVLCELNYDWFCPKGGQIIDPFCGGSVRGIVAAKMGMRYWGGDLRQEQVDANTAQGKKICGDACPKWICGDSNITMDSAPLADFIFSCPPYADLEVYSDDPNDLSNMDYEQFVEVYRSIIAKSCDRLKDNRFAAFVVGDIRDKNGHYRNFHGETIKAFLDAGLKLYNHAILINAVGTLALRVTRQFQAGRKLGKSHQDLLVFIKGDSKKATAVINNPPPSRPTGI